MRRRAGGRVLVVDVDEEAEPFPLRGRALPEPEPLGAEVLGHEPGTRVDENAPHPLRLELGQLLRKPLPLQLVIPDPERHRPVLSGRVGDGRPQLGPSGGAVSGSRVLGADAERVTTLVGNARVASYGQALNERKKADYC
jgi:hypothetical protein